MKYLFDTSVLVAAFVEKHPQHARAFPWLTKAKSGKIDWTVTSHSVAELYAVLTKMPIIPRVLPSEAYRMISENIPKQSVVTLSIQDYLQTLKAASELGLSGGITYDALIARGALKAKADRIVTFNLRDFRRIWPGRDRDIVAP